MAGFRAWAYTGNNQSSNTATLTLPISASAVAGDVALVSVNALSSSATLTTPSGWTLVSGPDRAATLATSWLLSRTLVSGDVGGTVTVTVSAATHLLAEIIVGQGVTTTGMLVASRTDTSNTSAPALPTLAGVPSGAFLVGFLNRRANIGPSSVGTPSGFTTGPYAQTNFGNSNLTSVGVWQVAASSGAFGGGSGYSSPSSAGVNYLVALPPSTGSSGSVAGVTAHATGKANAGLPSGAAVVLISGATAHGMGYGNAGVVTLVASPSAVWPPDPYRQAIRSPGLKITYMVDAYFNGSPVAGGQDLRPAGGSITDTTKPGVRRTLSLDLVGGQALYSLLAPIGTTLKVSAVVKYTNNTTFTIPMGVFNVDSERLTESSGKVSITAPDRWVEIQRARFIGPAASTPGLRVTDQIVQLIQQALGADEVVNVTAKSQATVGALTWEKDRDTAILDLAKDIGAWVYFNRDGVATVADLPTLGEDADWLIDASPSGVLIELDRTQSRTQTYNVVVVSSSASDGERFPTQYVWDSDPSSPTYAGENPVVSGSTAGPFGIVPYFFDSPILSTAAEAQGAGLTILARTVGVASSISAGAVPNPAMDSFDVIDVLPPKRRFDASRALERHVVDTVTHPLTHGTPLQVEGRSTRTDPYS